MTIRSFKRPSWCVLLAAGILVGCSGRKKAALPAAFTDMAPATVTPAFQAVTNQTDMLALRQPGAPYTLGPGDQLDIEMVGKTGSAITTFVGPDGKIYFNLLPGMDVWGLTLNQTRELLQRELGKYITSPEVAVTLREVASRHVWLLGRLNHPGIYALPGPMTLLEAIANAGGTASSASTVTTEELADLRHSFIMRDGKRLPVDFYRLLHDGDISQNVVLEPNDFVYLPSTVSQEVYVLGSVRAPSAVPYHEPMTLSTAIAGTGGPIYYELLSGGPGIGAGGIVTDAWLSHVAIVRGGLSQPVVAIVDYRAIIKSGAPDVRLEPGDIIYIPNSPYGTLKSYVNMVINTFVTTIAANEGLRAGGSTNTVGPAITVGSSLNNNPPPPAPH